MKWREDCVRCLIDARIYDAFKGNATDRELQFILSGTVGSMQFPKSKAFRYSWKIVMDILGDIYAFERRKLLEETLEKGVPEPSTLEDALKLAALGNLHDTAVGGSYRPPLEKKVRRMVVDGIEVLWNGGKMVYAVDNLPEVPYDIALAKYLQKEMGWDITLVAREEPYEIDATYPDLVELAQRLGWSGSVDVLPSDCTIFDTCEKAKELRQSSDIVLAKGLLNADAYVDFMPPEPALLVFAAKCKPLAEAVGAEIGDGVAVLGEKILKVLRG